MKLNFVLFTISIIALFALSPAASLAHRSIEASEFQPAIFRTDNFSLAEQISFPWDYKRGEDFRMSIACTARVTREGRMRHPFCLAGDEVSRSFERLILLATQRAKMEAARLNGRRTPVSMKFTAIFERAGGDATVTVVPNQFLNSKAYGVKYSAPQLLVEKTKGYTRNCRRLNILMKITVDANGDASDAHLYQGNPEAKGCIQSVQNRISELRYLPGTVNGVPTTMDHLYLVSWRGGWSLLGRSW